MRLSELIIRFIDWFYRRPVSALLPRQTFRYAVCGGANVVFGWGCYFLLYNFVLDKELLDLGFIAVSPHVAAMLIVFPLTFFTGFWLNRHVAFRRSPLATGTQLFRYLLSVAGSVVVNYALAEILRRVVRVVGDAFANDGTRWGRWCTAIWLPSISPFATPSANNRGAGRVSLSGSPP